METDWNELMHRTDNANGLYNKIYRRFCDIYNESIKVYTVTKKGSMNPWKSEEVIRYCEYRDKLYKNSELEIKNWEAQRIKK